MEFEAFQKLADRTSTFTGKQAEYELMYLGLGIANEAGEVAGKIKKVIRDDDGVVTPERREAIKQELGDVLWYLSQITRVLGLTLSEVAQANADKLTARMERGTIKGDGDTR